MTLAVAEPLSPIPPPLLPEHVHRSRLYAAGIDPSTNVGMSNLSLIHRRMANEFDGMDDVVLLIRLGRYAYAFGAEARLVRRFRGLESVGCCELGMGTWEAIRCTDLDAIVGRLEDIGHPVIVVTEKNWRSNIGGEA